MISIRRNEIFDFGNSFSDSWISCNITFNTRCERRTKEIQKNDNIIHYVGDGGEFYRMDFENNIGQCIIGAITVVIGVVFWYKFLW